MYVHFCDYHGSLATSFADYMKERQLYYAQERRWENNSFWQRRQPDIMHPYPKSAFLFYSTSLKRCSSRSG